MSSISILSRFTSTNVRGKFKLNKGMPRAEAFFTKSVTWQSSEILNSCSVKELFSINSLGKKVPA